MDNKNANETPAFFQIPKILNDHPDITNDHLIIFMHLYDQLRQRNEWNKSNPELSILAKVSLPTLKRKLNDLESWGFLDRKGMGHNRKFSLGSKFNNRSTSEPDTKPNRLTSLPVLAHTFTSTGSPVDYIDKNSFKDILKKTNSYKKPKKSKFTKKPTIQEMQDFYHGLPNLEWVGEYRKEQGLS